VDRRDTWLGQLIVAQVVAQNKKESPLEEDFPNGGNMKKCTQSKEHY